VCGASLDDGHAAVSLRDVTLACRRSIRGVDGVVTGGNNLPVQKVKAFLATPAGRFLLRFVIILVVGFTVLAAKPVDEHVVKEYTTFVAHEARIVLNAFGEGATVVGQTLRSPRFAVVIYNGCNGLEAMLIFVCGVLAFPSTWRRKLLGIALGFLAIQVVNIVRVVSLFYVGVLKPEWFSTAHVFVWQSVIILFGVLLWVLWVQRYAMAREA
jgi:exosortase H (IPTLxxWG-CTERM-specific)